MAAGGRRARALAGATPATLMVFDVLVDQGADLSAQPWIRRREWLELRAATWWPPVQLTPYTDEIDEAAGWMEALAPMGTEGVVAKRASARYGVPGSWVKVKHRQNLEGVVGAVNGPLPRPEALVVVVEVLANTARSGGRRRHPLRFVRVRLD